ncbi:MAG: 30S ribosomal protein S15 [Patescibacteria group bacterium]|nr:30S ribosomal protein S15 [Patescibacteria group bacterium]
MLSSRTKKKVISETQKHATDTGSAEVQVSLVSRQIDELASHLKHHPKDDSSRRGLLKMVSKRRKLLNYLAAHSPSSYQKTIKKLGLKK